MGAILNAKNERTKRIIHLMITDKCNRNCKYCCNKQYDVNEIPVVTTEELLDAECIFLTGGEPFAYSDPVVAAFQLRHLFSNIQRVYVYTNALELAEYLKDKKAPLVYLDGLTISIKNAKDKRAFEEVISKDERVLRLKSNWLYVFKGFEDVECPSQFQKKVREWQDAFVAAPDSIFRRTIFN